MKERTVVPRVPCANMFGMLVGPLGKQCGCALWGLYFHQQRNQPFSPTHLNTSSLEALCKLNRGDFALRVVNMVSS